jgi:ABC-type Fe3+-hydroxamate transport system substrate-binding protein
MQTDAFINAWAADAAAAALAVEQRFVYVEARLEEISERTEGMTVMVIQGGVQLQTAMGTLGGMLNQLGFTNVSDAPGAMVLIDFEQALYYDPDWVFFVGSQATPQEVEDYMVAEMANNQSYWDAIPAVYEGRVIFLGTPFISSAGLGVVDRLNDLIDIVNSVVLED